MGGLIFKTREKLMPEGGPPMKKVTKLRTFSVQGGGGGSTQFLCFLWGVFHYIAEAILADENLNIKKRAFRGPA